MARDFLGGVPYSVDVHRLQEQFPAASLTEGRVILHGDLEAVVGTKAGAQRYYGVVNSWMNQIKNEHAILIIWEPKVGIKVLHPSERLVYAESRTRQKIRQTKKAVNLFGWVERSRLEPIDQQRFDHSMRVALAMKNALAAARREFAFDLPAIASLPRPNRIECLSE